MKKRPQRLVFIDETGTTTKMTRLRGRARRGQRLKMKAPFGHWGTQTFIAALRHDGLTAPWVIDRPMNRQIFEAYVETQLAPTLKPGDMVILDNLSSHKSERAAATSTPSKWPSPNSKPICARPKPEPSKPCGRPSDQSAISTRPRNAGTTSSTQDMLQINGSML
jgi:hypothetical protein